MAVAGQSLQATPFAREIRTLLQTALVLFVFTVVVGILNGTDLADFDRKALLTHVHAGTLGWITLSVLAAALWLFGEGGEGAAGWHTTLARWLSYGAAIFVAMYALAFLTTVGAMRPVAGGAVLFIISGFLVWLAVRARHVRLTVPHLGILAAVATSAVGSVLGVLIGIEFATGDSFLPEGAFDAHPAVMVVGFLVPVGMAITEWSLRSGQTLPAAGRLGTAQIALPFVGGLMLMVGALLDIVPLIILNLPFEIAGVAIYVWRLWPDLVRVRWVRGAHERLCALSVVFLVFNLLWLTYLIGRYEGDFDKVPFNLILILDHTMFIGVMTNTIFALMAVASSARHELWSWADNVILVGVNVGLAGFVAGLLADEAVLKQTFTPIMGIAILLGIAVFTARFQTEPAPAKAEAPVI